MAQPTFREGGYDYGSLGKWAAGGVVAAIAISLGVGVSLFGALAVVFGVMLIGNGALVVPRWRKAQRVSVEPVGSLTPGQGAVEVVGAAQPDRGLTTAPYSGRDCVAYAFEIEDYELVSTGGARGTHSTRRKWRTKYHDTDSRDFFVDDGTGIAWVDPADAEFDLGVEEQFELDAGERPPEAAARVLDGSDLSVVNDHNKRRFAEYRLDQGEEIHVAGVVNEPPTVEGDDAGAVNVSVTDGDATPLFSVSTDPSADVGEKLKQRAAGGIGFGVALVAIGVGIIVFA